MPPGTRIVSCHFEETAEMWGVLVGALLARRESYTLAVPHEEVLQAVV